MSSELLVFQFFFDDVTLVVYQQLHFIIIGFSKLYFIRHAVFPHCLVYFLNGVSAVFVVDGGLNSSRKLCKIVHYISTADPVTV